MNFIEIMLLTIFFEIFLVFIYFMCNIEQVNVYKKALEICCEEESEFRERVLVGNERLSKYYFRVEIKPEEYIALAKEDNQ